MVPRLQARRARLRKTARRRRQAPPVPPGPSTWDRKPRGRPRSCASGWRASWCSSQAVRGRPGGVGVAAAPLRSDTSNSWSCVGIDCCPARAIRSSFRAMCGRSLPRVIRTDERGVTSGSTLTPESEAPSGLSPVISSLAPVGRSETSWHALVRVLAAAQPLPGLGSRWLWGCQQRKGPVARTGMVEERQAAATRLRRSL